MKIIGLGTGRCGTVSLTALMAGNMTAIHEKFTNPLPWEFDWKLLEQRIEFFEFYKQPIFEAAFYYLPYVPDLIAEFDDMKFICLQRERSKTVKSFMATIGNDHHWIIHTGEGWDTNEHWDESFPKYKGSQRQSSIERYYDNYYYRARRFEQLFPEKFRIFQIEDLNTAKGQDKIFQFIGLEDHEHLLPCVFNQR